MRYGYDDDASPRGDVDPRITDAIKFMRRVSDNDSVNRSNAQTWRKFRYGEQWPPELQNSRTLEQRPCITINKTDAFCRQVENQQRQQRPRIKVDPTNGEATKKTAELIQGMIRHIENTRGGGDIAYDGGFSAAITEGVGYWRGMSDYTRQDSFEQELFLEAIDDPLSVYYDDHSILPDGSDAEEVLIISDMARDAFRVTYPDKDDGSNFIASDIGGYNDSDWVTKDTIRVAEYFTVERKAEKLVKLSTGEVGWKSDLDPRVKDKVTIVDQRDGQRRLVKWCKITAIDVLDERTLPGRWIPVFPCYGEIVIIDGKRLKSGLIKNAMDPQRMLNFWKTAMTESVALAPKVKWLMAEGQDEDHENEWATANISARATLRYKPTDVSGQPAPPPQRLQPEPPPEGAMAMAASVDQDLTSVLGIVDPAMRIGGNVSGKALNSERQQSDNSTFHYYDNLTRSIAFTGRWMLDVMKYYYSEPGRVVRIIGDDGQSTTDKINQPSPQAPDDPTQVINDITVGEYDVVMDTGPGYNTKRQEAVDSMMPLFEKNEELMKLAGDVMFRNMDFPGAEVIADRMAAANPLAQVDDKSPVPPQIQMKLKAQDQQIQHLTQQLQAAAKLIKDRADLKSMEEAAETHRLLVKEAGQTERNTDDNQAWMHDTAAKTQAQLGVAEINQAGKIITQTKGHEHDAQQTERKAERELTGFTI